MTIEYEVTEQDYINFNIDFLNSSKTMKTIRRILLNVFPIVVSFVILWILKKDFLFSTLGIITFCIVSSIVVFVLGLFESKMTEYLLRKTMPAFLKNGKANTFLGKQSIKLAEECIEDGNETRISKIKYSAIERIDFGHGLFYIYIGAIEAIIIPARAFVNEEQKNSFFDIISEKTNLDLTHIKQIKLNS